jgi:hypothetical protein
MRDIRAFIVLAGYYRHVPNFTRLAKPMTNLTKEDVPFEWTHVNKLLMSLKEF